MIGSVVTPEVYFNCPGVYVSTDKIVRCNSDLEIFSHIKFPRDATLANRNFTQVTTCFRVLIEISDQ